MGAEKAAFIPASNAEFSHSPPYPPFIVPGQGEDAGLRAANGTIPSLSASALGVGPWQWG